MKNLLTTCLLSATISALFSDVAAGQQNPHGQLAVTSFPSPFLFLIRDPLVHDDLTLTAQQREAIATLNDELDKSLWSMRNKSPEHIAKTMRKATETAKASLLSILTAQQQRRVGQIEMWALGPKSLVRDDVSTKLRITDQQQTTIRDTMAQTQEKIQELAKKLQDGGDRADIEEQARSLRNDELKKLLSTLTQSQRSEWTSLLGDRIDVSQLGRVKFRAPELNHGGEWINASPQTLAQLRGQVVAVHFYAFACINCKRNFPWYKNWHTSFADRGLVVLGIHTPEVDRERDVANVCNEASGQGLAFPILVDNDKRNWDAWGNSMWPSVYLVDKRGYVRYWWYGELNWQGAAGEKLLRTRIEELLEE